ncbi:verrucotoxin subunit beta-like [Pleurodeles waltl]|uniref:verrucotoxin subunit beta-like n=1 Tax=Pleurodeles waltl TaxID=8319 RepID=UPI003709B0EF
MTLVNKIRGDPFFQVFSAFARLPQEAPVSAVPGLEKAPYNRRLCPLSERMASDKTIERLTLGRPLALGMLYDIRRDAIIPGMTLWDKAAIKNDVRESLQPNTEFKIVASDSMEDKASSLNVSASLKASFLGGLIEVGGSAKFLNERKKSRNQARVTLQYTATTKFEQLSMNHLGPKNIQYPSVFDQKDVTHVVTAVLYGAKAFFVFDREVSASESMQDVKGTLQIAVKSIPTFSIEGEGSLQMNDTIKENMDTFTCTFCGDFALPFNPVTYQDAIKAFSTLPSLVEKNAIPVKVWLHPINDFDSKPSQMLRTLSAVLIGNVQDVLEELSYFDMECNDLLKEPAATTFPDVKIKIKTFQKNIMNFRLIFQKEVARLLPAIRGAGEEEIALVDLITSKEQSPFSTLQLTEFLEAKEEEINFVNAYLKVLQGIKMTPTNSELNQVKIDPMVDCVFSFTFTSLQDEEPYLSEQKQWLQMQFKNTPDTTPTKPVIPQNLKRWFSDEDIIRKSRVTVKAFIDFEKWNRTVLNRKLQFTVSSVQDPSNPGVSIYWYEAAKIKSRAFEPPKANSPVVNTMTHDGALFSIPTSSEIKGYRVEYRSREEDNWTVAASTMSKESVIVTRLVANSVYQFRQSAVYNEWFSFPSDSTSFLTTRPVSTPRKVEEVKEKAGVITLTWLEPAVIATGYRLSEYKIEYKEQAEQASQDGKEKWIEQKVPDKALKSSIDGLKLNTPYCFRVSVLCESGERSLPSEVRVCSATQEIKPPPPPAPAPAPNPVTYPPTRPVRSPFER